MKPVAGEVVRWTVSDGDQIRYVSWQDCEPIVDSNKAWQNEPTKRGETFRRIGSIPNVILFKWLTEEWDRGNTSLRYLSEEFNQIIARKLRDPDWKWLRTT